MKNASNELDVNRKGYIMSLMRSDDCPKKVYQLEAVMMRGGTSPSLLQHLTWKIHS